MKNCKNEAPKTSGCLNAEKGDTNADIPGRHIGPIPEGAYIEEGFGRGSSDTLPARVRHQHEEVGLGPFTCAGLPGVYGRHQADDVISPTREGGESMQTHAEPELDFPEEVSSPDRPTDVNTTCSPPSPSSLQGSTENEESGSQRIYGLRPSVQTPTTSKTRLGVVDSVSPPTQRSEHSPTNCPPGDDIRCISGGLGCHLKRGQNRGNVDKGGEAASHQCTGAKGRFPGTASIRFSGNQHTCPPTHRQYNSDCLPEQERRRTLAEAIRPSCPGVGVVSHQEDHPASGTYTRQGERGSGQ